MKIKIYIIFDERNNLILGAFVNGLNAKMAVDNLNAQNEHCSVKTTELHFERETDKTSDQA